MKINNRPTKPVAMSIAMIAVAVIYMTWPASREAAREEFVDEFLAYGIANVAPGQTARLHVVTVGITEIQPADLLIFDKQGNLLAHSAERLLPGRAVELDLRFDEQPGVAGGRLEFYAMVRFERQRGRDRGYVIPSLEVIEDATGKTIYMIADPMG